MLGGLLGSKFSNKCKQAIKYTSARLALIRNKKEATIRWLKKDVADLLAAGHEANAFGRIDALLVELNHASCNDMIDQYCQYVLSQLPNLQKQRECPQEANEAISTLIFAAARFPDLPELCDLRHVFTERYGNCMQSSINAEFVEKNEKKSFPKAKRLELMQSIAEEFTVRWDRMALDHPSRDTPAPQPAQPRKVVPPGMGNDGLQVQQAGRKKEIPSNGKYGSNVVDGVKRQQDSMELQDIHVISTSYKGQSRDPVEKTQNVIPHGTEKSQLYQANNAIPLYSKPRRNSDGNDIDDEIKGGHLQRRMQKEQNYLDPRLEKQEVVLAKACKVKPVNMASEEAKTKDNSRHVEEITVNGMVSPHTKFNRVKNGYHVEEKNADAQEHSRLQRQEGIQRLEKQSVRAVNNDGYVIPPYVKPLKCSASKSDHTAQNIAVGNQVMYEDTVDAGRHRDEPCHDEKPKPISVRKFKKPQVTETSQSTNTIDALTQYAAGDQRIYGVRQKNDTNGDIYVEEKITIRDLRLPNEDETDSAIYYGKLLPRPSSERRRHSGRRTDLANGGQYDEEQMAMDKLLQHYSQKRIDKEHSRDRTRVTAAIASNLTDPESFEYPGNGTIHSTSRGSAPPPHRAVSLPSESISSTSEVKSPARTTSMQPNISKFNNGGRVHPNLPEYSELAARLAALRKT